MVIEAIVLGVVQGVTEFLPISSSAHLVLLPWLFGWRGTLVDSLSFDVALHAGTLIAIVAFFWRDWFDLLRKLLAGLGDGTWRTGEGRLAWYIVLATLPAGLLGLKFEHVIEERFRSPLLIAGALAVASLAIWAADRFSRRTRRLEAMTLGHALVVGCCQAVALVPGVSRSGSTIVGGLLTGYDRESAARFSFLLSTPVIAGAAVMKLHKLHLAPGEALPFALGTVCSAAVGYLCIKFLLGYLGRHSLSAFVWYRLALAVGVAALWAVRGG